jgi:hypothetical protein
MEEGARSRLTAAERELDTARASFAEELANLQGEYERERGVILEKIAAEKKEIDRLVAEAEVDGSVEVRRVACEELAGAINALVTRADAPAPEKNEGD